MLLAGLSAASCNRSDVKAATAPTETGIAAHVVPGSRERFFKLNIISQNEELTRFSDLILAEHPRDIAGQRRVPSVEKILVLIDKVGKSKLLIDLVSMC